MVIKHRRRDLLFMMVIVDCHVRNRPHLAACVSCMPVRFVNNQIDLLPLCVAVHHDISYIPDTINDLTQS